MTHFSFGGVGAGPLPSKSFIGTQSIFTGSAGSVSWTIPAAGPSAYAVVVVGYAGTARTPATIGGNASTQVAAASETTSNLKTNIWVAPLTPGTTTVSIPTSTGSECYMLYVVNDLANAGAASDTGATTGSGLGYGKTLSALNAPGNSIVIGGAFNASAGAAPTAHMTWSGGVTVDASVNNTAGLVYVETSAASAVSAAATLTLSYSWSTGGLNGASCGCAAAFI